MADFLEEIASYLDTNSPDLIFDNDTGRNVFVGEYNEDIPSGVMILGQPGNTISSNRDVKELHFPRFQLLTRDESYSTASDLMETARTILHGLIDKQTASYRVLRVHTEQEAYPMGKDGKGRYEFTCNFIAEYHPLA